jgi:hypothetical protein
VVAARGRGEQQVQAAAALQPGWAEVAAEVAAAAGTAAAALQPGWAEVAVEVAAAAGRAAALRNVRVLGWGGVGGGRDNEIMRGRLAGESTRKRWCVLAATGCSMAGPCSFNTA